jgi:SH3-like domain-containing protein
VRIFRPLAARTFSWPILAAVAFAALVLPQLSAAKTGLPVPRFVSLGVDKANVRNGPGKRYPIGWVFVRRGVPLEVIAEYELWRKIRDVDGAVGWIHRSLLSNRRRASVKGDGPRPLRRQPNANSDVIARLEPGVIGRLLECGGTWCRLEVGGRRGWIARASLWGVLPLEKTN